MHLMIKIKQKIVIYTDSLVAKSKLTDKRLPANSKMYTALRDRYQELIDTNQLDIVIKKVNAHVGIEMNEIVDTIAKNRLKIVDY